MFELIRTILDGLLIFALHLSNPGSFPKPLSAAKEREYLEKARAGDAHSRSLLIEHNLRLVSHIIKKYYSVCSDHEDLISIGTIGLIKAIDSFDCSKGARLATYAARCIENEILMHFRSRKKEALNISFSEPIDTDSEGNPLTLMDIMSKEETIADDIDADIKTRMLYKYVEEMTNEREKEIIIRRYGLYDTQEETQREIADSFNISRSYVSRIEKKVIDDLKVRFGVR